MNGTGGGADSRATGGTCGREDLRIALGALALDALDAEEAREVRRHMADCGECQVEYSSLVGVRSLMDAGLVGGLVRSARRPIAVEVPPTPKSRRPWVSASRRGLLSARPGGPVPRRRIALGMAGAVASVALIVGGVVAVAERAPTSRSATNTPVHWVSGRNDEGVTAKIEYRQVAWGTWIQVTMAHTLPYSTCTLMAVGKDGRVEFASSWAADPTGKSVTVPGGVSMALADIDHFDVVLGPNDQIQVPASALVS